jgi:dihydropteroate synthase-like protein
MKVLIVTGRHMEERVRNVAEKFGHEVFVAPVDIAAFIRTEHLMNIGSYNLILVPGYSKADLHVVEKATRVTTVKGPKDVANLETVLENLDAIELSKTTPACELLKKQMRDRAIAEVKNIDTSELTGKLLKKPGNLTIGGLAVGRDFPMRVVAEIVDADKMADEDVVEKARYCLGEGADIIDIGISRKAPSRVKELIYLLRGLKVPLSVDTMEHENILAAIDSEADLILSVDKELVEGIPPTNIPLVVVPGRKRFETVKERVSALEENIELAEKLGIKKVVADPILEPINYGLTESIAAYKEFGKKSETPLLMGVGNVTELTDADSIGINAILAGIAMECGVSLLFTTEASDKTRGSIKELKAASYMMFLAKNRNTTPKDLGIDLLVYKEKRRSAKSPQIKTKKVKATGGQKKRDFAGDFTIAVDGKIMAVHTKDDIPDVSVEGGNARDIGDTILRLGLVSDLGHALYLGRELEKAETALKTGRSYVQDEPLFRGNPW